MSTYPTENTVTDKPKRYTDEEIKFRYDKAYELKKELEDKLLQYYQTYGFGFIITTQWVEKPGDWFYITPCF